MRKMTRISLGVEYFKLQLRCPAHLHFSARFQWSKNGLLVYYLYSQMFHYRSKTYLTFSMIQMLINSLEMFSIISQNSIMEFDYDKNLV